MSAYATDDRGRLIRACTVVDPDLMVCDEGRENNDPVVLEAKAVCHTCAFAAECRAGAYARQEPVGIWGGETTRERQARRRKHYRVLAAAGDTEMLEVAL